MATRELLLRVVVDQHNQVRGVYDASTGERLPAVRVEMPPKVPVTYESSTSDRQYAVLRFLAEYDKRFHRSPTVREIGLGTGMTSTGHVYYHLGILERQGWIVRDPHINRSIRLLKSLDSTLREAV